MAKRFKKLMAITCIAVLLAGLLPGIKEKDTVSAATVKTPVVTGDNPISTIDVSMENYDRPVIEVDGKPFFYNGVQLRSDWIRNNMHYDDEMFQNIYSQAAADGFTVVNSQLYWLHIQPDQIFEAAEATYISGGSNADTNFADSTSIKVKGGEDDDEKSIAYFKFDFSSLDSNTLDSEEDASKIRIFVENMEDGVADLHLYAIMNNDWAADEITWNNHPDVRNEGVEGVDYVDLGGTPWFDPVKQVQAYDFDVTDFINQYVYDKVDKIASFILVGENGVGVSIDRESMPDNDPSTNKNIGLAPSLVVSRANVFNYDWLDKVIGWSEVAELKLELLWFGSQIVKITADNSTPYYVIHNYEKMEQADGNQLAKIRTSTNAVSLTDNSVYMYSMSLDDPDLRAHEYNVLKDVMDHVAEYNTAHGDKKTVIGVQVLNEPGSGIGGDRSYSPYSQAAFEAGGYTDDTKGRIQFRYDSFWDYSQNLAKAVKDSNYPVYTRMNFHTEEFDYVYRNERVKAEGGTTYMDFVGYDPYTGDMGEVYQYGQGLNDDRYWERYNYGTNFPMIMETSALATDSDYLNLSALAGGSTYNLYQYAGSSSFGMRDYDLTPRNKNLDGIVKTNHWLNKLWYDLASKKPDSAGSDAKLIFFNHYADTEASVTKKVRGIDVNYATTNKGVGVAVEKSEKEIIIASKTASTFTLKDMLSYGPVTMTSGYYDKDANWISTGDKAYSIDGTDLAVAMDEYEVVKVTAANPLPALDTAYVIHEDFNELSEQWTISNAGGSAALAAVPGVVDQSLQITSGSQGQTSAEQAFAPLSGDVKIQARLLPGQTGKWFGGPYVYDSEGNSLVEVAFDASNQIVYRSGNGNWTSVQQYTDRTWFEIGIVIHTESNTFDVSVNDKASVTGAPLAMPAADVAKIKFLAEKGAAAVHVDQIKVYQDRIIPTGISGNLLAYVEQFEEDGGIATAEAANQLKNELSQAAGYEAEGENGNVVTSLRAFITLLNEQKEQELINGSAYETLTAVTSSLSRSLFKAEAELIPSKKNVLPGESFDIQAIVHNAGEVNLESAEVSLQIPEGWDAVAQEAMSGEPILPGSSASQTFRVTVSDQQSQIHAAPISVTAHYQVVGGLAEVQAQTFVAVAPQLTITEMKVTPEIVEPGEVAKLSITYQNNADAPAEGLLTVEAPAEWQVAPSDRTYNLSGGQEQTVEFDVIPSPDAVISKADLLASFSSDGAVSAQSSVTVQLDLPILTTEDASDNPVTGTLAGHVVEGVSGNAIEGYVELPDADKLDISGKSSLTLELWVKPEVNDGSVAIIAKGDMQYTIKVKDSSNLQFFIYSGGWRSVTVPLPQDWVGNWHHIAGVYDQSNVMLYIDEARAGVLSSSNRSINSVDYPLNIGRSASTPTADLFKGAIDQVRLYNKALSEAELSNSSRQPDANTVLWMDFDAFQAQVASEDAQDIHDAARAIAGNSYSVDEADATNESTVTAAILGQLNELEEMSAASVTASEIKIVSFTPAALGKDGSFTFTATLAKGADTGKVSAVGTIVAAADTTPPVITLNGQAEVTIPLNGEYTDAGATAIDDREGDISYLIEASITYNGEPLEQAIDTGIAGEYTYHYNVSDAAGNTAQEVTRMLIIQEDGESTPDTVLPVITLSGLTVVEVTYGASYNDMGATAVDDRDGDLTTAITSLITYNDEVVEAIDTEVPGTYLLVYNVSDAAGNAAEPVTRTVIVNEQQQEPDDAEAISEAKSIIEEATYFVNEGTANTQEAVDEWLFSQIAGLAGLEATGVTVGDLTVSDFTAAADGTDGSFAFTATLSKGEETSAVAGNGIISAAPVDTQPTPTPTPTPTPSTTASPSVSPVPTHPVLGADDLTDDGNGAKTVQVSEDQDIIFLPGDVADLIGDNALRLNKKGLSIVVPNAMLNQLQQQAEDHNANSVQVDIAAAQTKQALGSLVNKANRSETVQLTAASKLYRIGLSGAANEEEDQALNDWAQPITLVFDIDPSVDASLLGVYRIASDGSMQYVGGKMANGTMIVEANEAGSYAILEYNKLFEDVPPTMWASAVIKQMAAKHIIEGVSDTQFNSQGIVTRAQFATMIARALDLKATDGASYSDVGVDDWYAAAVAAASEAGIVQGQGTGNFAPDATVSREEMAVMLARAYAYVTGEAVKSNDGQSFADSAHISNWAQEASEFAKSIGLINGRNDNIFAPKEQSTRAESAQAIANLLKLMYQEGNTIS
ncbi:LamG-like jellyroll fold domain-containing protein [Paenibacillus sp. HB172176]|uniref:LamG-like jellyroll fold domain-containing protein n=1 Tax=Paenibacillus sp. HB172176 TaxID=2493690 RepID=UPI00143C266A|nr:LamG-like jellyroll fold domain-containing protein [Paenibacillus sp. HB172176]